MDARDTVVASQLKASAGLAMLESKQYSLAARKFLDVSPEMGSSFNEVITLRDVAAYGTLCALASFERGELKAKLMNSNLRR